MKDQVDRVIYCFWTGNNPITPNRMNGLKMMRENIKVPIVFLDKAAIEERILPEAPFHPAYQYLSCNHKSDYLRCYFMYHLGGGYADIKPHTKNNNWKECFDYINRYKEIELIGQHDTKGGIADLKLRSATNAEALVACGWMICRPHSKFTTEWYSRVNKVLDMRYDVLRKHPASEPFGGVSYPLRWAEVCGEIFHRWQYEYAKVKPNAIRNCLRTGWMGFNVAYR